MNTPQKASIPVIKRLPKYYRYLRSLQDDGLYGTQPVNSLGKMLCLHSVLFFMQSTSFPHPCSQEHPHGRHAAHRQPQGPSVL